MARLDYTQPPESLADELREVAGNARALQETLRRSNGLPDDFPALQLDEFLAGLQALVDGTAEGCREPLTYARGKLPQIRREYILTEARSAGAKIEGDQVPPLMRGETIDKALSALMASVSTALDEYRRLAGESGVDEVDTSSSQTLDQDAPDVRSAIKAASSAEGQLDAAKNEVEKLVKPDSVKGDELKRQLTDARGLYRLARIELRMPQFVPEWLKRTASVAKDYPGLLRKTSKAIHVGVDVAESVNKVWTRFQDKMISASFEAIRDAADELLNLANKWEKKSKSSQGEVKLGNPPDDFDLDKVREDILVGKEPKPEWRPWVIYLNLRHRKITNIAPLRNLVNLQTLNLSNTQVADIEPIKQLVNLRHIKFNDTPVANIDPIKQLVKLQSLDFENSQVNNIDPIKKLVNLQNLTLRNTHVADIVSIRSLLDLKCLDIEGTPVTNIDSIKMLLSLEQLYLSGTQVSDVEPIKKLVNLQILDLSETPITDIQPIRQLVNLNMLYLSGTKVSNIEPLKKIVNLQYLDIENTQVADIAPLKQHINLMYLDIQGTKIDDISSLNHLKNLKDIYVEKDRVHPLANTLGRQGIVKSRR